jgi:hypothetical protein
MAEKIRKNPQWTAGEKEDITTIIDVGLAYGLPVEAIVTDLVDHFSKMSRTMAIAYVANRKREIPVSKARLQMEEDLNRGVQLLRYESIYGLAMQRGDLKAALTAAKEIGAVQGLTVDMPSKPVKSRSVNVENMNVLGIPDSVLKGLEEMSEEQLQISWANHEFTEDQAKLLYDQSRGIDSTGGEE